MKRRCNGANWLLAVSLAAGLVSARGVLAEPLSGFEGDLTSTIGASWVIVGALPEPTFVEALTEGAQAVQVANDPINGSWPAFQLPGVAPLAELIVRSRSLVFDASTSPGMAWRQIFVIINSSNGWGQPPGAINLTAPIEGDLYDHAVVDLNSSLFVGETETTYRAHSQAWLDAPGDWFELTLAIQGSEVEPEETPYTILDNFKLLAADFILDGYVDGADLSELLSGFGVSVAGDADYDGDTDGADVLLWQREVEPAPPIFAIGAVPEPSTLGLTAAAAAAWAAGRRRRRR